MKKKLLVIISISIMAVSIMCGCSKKIKLDAKALESQLSGLEVTIRTFDEESNIIDSIHGKSVNIQRDTTFDTSNSDGYSNKDSSVIKITIGHNEINHVGSSLIMAEESLNDIFNEYRKTVTINNNDAGIPLINSVVNSFKNDITGKEKTILIRSQNGTPLATYMGNSVSVFSSEIPKTTVVLIDDKVLVIYRCDYTIYDTELLLEE